MTRSRLVLTLTIIALLLLVSATLFACDGYKASVELVIEGEAYRGAVCNIYAIVKNIENKSDFEFSIVEDYDWVLIKEDKLLFTKDAIVGANVTIKVTVGEITDSVTMTVANTPVETIVLEEIPELKAGDEYNLVSSVSPHYADDVPITYSILKGEDIASIVDGVLKIANEADYTDELQIKALAGNKESNIVTIKISTIQPRTLNLSATNYELKRGETTQITCEVTPANCTIGTAELIVPESEYYSYSQGVLQISNTAPEGEIEIQAKLGALTQSITIKIIKTPIESISITSNSSPFVKYGEVVELNAEVKPQNATYPNVEISILEGEEYIEFNGNVFKVTTKEVGKQIVFLARADGKTANLAFETVEIEVENFDIIVNDGVSVSVGEKRKIEIDVTPLDATEKIATYSIIEGEENAVLDGNEILFVSLSGTKTEVTVSVTVGKITKEITFYIVPIPVESVVISTTDKTTELKANDTVTFNAAVTPENASFLDVTYHFEMGEQLGSISGNVFTVNPSADSGRVMIYAMSVDGIKSNTVTLEVSGKVKYIKPTKWADIDNKADVFDDMKSVILDLGTLPTEANNTTVIVSDDVQYIEILGGFDGINNRIYDLFFYFLTTDYIYVLFENIGITADDGFSDYVVDFGPEATVTLEMVGVNEIIASSVYKLNAEGFMVDGEITGSETDYIRKNGMDGIGGRNGGTAINAYNIEITGKGNLRLVAGSGADGTDGTRGANSANGVFAGNGGNGGYGGDSGFAIFANTFVCNVKGLLQIVGGNAGIGGDGGLGGLSGDGEHNGSNGKKGADGTINYPIFTSEQSIFLTNNYTIQNGKIQSNSEVRSIVYDEFAEQLANYYKIGVHYGTDLNNPHSTRFAMNELTSVKEITRMLYSLEFALQSLPKNLYFEIMQSAPMINIYIVESITRRPSSVVYGLTSNVNNLWFATFTTRLRGIYYSTPLNIMIHELFHVLTYNLDEATDSSLKATLPSYNLGNSYSTNSKGVYDPTKGYTAANSVFLCSYSKSNYSEDVSDNISLIAMLVTKPDYLENGTAFYKKVVYINSVYVGYYKNLTDLTVLSWKKYI